MEAGDQVVRRRFVSLLCGRTRSGKGRGLKPNGVLPCHFICWARLTILTAPSFLINLLHFSDDPLELAITDLEDSRRFQPVTSGRYYPVNHLLDIYCYIPTIIGM